MIINNKQELFIITMTTPIKYSIKIIPYFIYENKQTKSKDLYMLLGKDSKWKEWTPIGGRREVNEAGDLESVLHCLSREIYEETKELLELKKINLDKCIVKEFETKFRHGLLKTIFIFVRLNSMKDIKEKIKLFTSKNRDLKLKRKYIHWKIFFEMDELQFIKVNDDKFFTLTFNTFLDLQKNKQYYTKFDNIFYEDIVDTFKNFLDEYKFDTREYLYPRFDPKFLQGILSILPDCRYINDIITNLFTVLEKNKNVCSNCF